MVMVCVVAAFKKGIDYDESRQRREEVSTELRKNKREDMLQKRRQTVTVTAAKENVGEAANSSRNSGADYDCELSVAEQVRSNQKHTHKKIY